MVHVPSRVVVLRPIKQCGRRRRREFGTKEEKTCHTKWESKRTSHLEHLWDFRGTYSFNLPFLLKNRKKHIFTKKYKKHASSTQVWNEAKNRMSSEPKILYNFQRRTCHMLMGNYAVRLTRSCTIQIDSQIAKRRTCLQSFFGKRIVNEGGRGRATTSCLVNILRQTQ